MTDKDKSKKAGHSEMVFEAEVSRLLEMMVHSVYSDKDIFLRELISNASDACEKLRFLGQTDADLIKDNGDFQITVVIDNDAGSLSIEDNGVGMDKKDLMENLGTIARSGTKAFLDNAEEAKDNSASALIGQFGVGFYSVFMVASWVEVTTKKAGTNKAWVWTSEGKGSYKISEMDGEGVPPGTTVTLHLKEDEKKYLDVLTLEGILKSYSAHIPIPVKLAKMPGAEEKAEDPIDIGDGTALWRKSKSEITAEEYQQFYQMTGGVFGDPALTLHYKVEGRQEYTVLAFIPDSKPFDLFDPERRGKMKLYVRRVFITDEATLLPSWLRFVRGLIDSEDLPLNISREMLQESPALDAIRKAVQKRVMSELTKMSEKEADKYANFWDSFGPVLKEGLYEDPMARDEIFALCRFKTSKSGDKFITLKDYVAGMKDNQTAIYFATGESADAILQSPQLEGFASKDVEVLLLSDHVDSFWTSTALGFDGKPFQSVTQGNADLTNIDGSENEKSAEDKADDKADDKTAEVAALVSFLEEELKDHVVEVKISNRLSKSPCCLIAPQMGPDRRLERMLSQAQGNSMSKPIFELNPAHELVVKMADAYKSNDKDLASEFGHLLFDQACILDGERPVDANAFAQRMTKLMISA